MPLLQQTTPKKMADATTASKKVLRSAPCTPKDLSFLSKLRPGDADPVSSATPAPGLTEAAGNSTSVAPTDPAVTLSSTEGSTTFYTEAPFATTVQPGVSPEGCLCDLTPDFCDIGCCCDNADCSVADLSTIFRGCPQKPVSGDCIEKWLMFRANVDSSLVTVNDTSFCVQRKGDEPQFPAALPQHPAVADSHHFSLPQAPRTGHSRSFYRADDVIQTYLSNSSLLGLLRQPSPGIASLCVDRNPAKFLRSGSLSCTRILTPESCTIDPNLNARSYFSDLSVLKIPVTETKHMSELLIPVTPLSNWPVPIEQENSCINVVKKVEFVVRYTGRGELTNVTVNVITADVDTNQLLLQTHSVQFQVVKAAPTPTSSLPPRGTSLAVGFHVGSFIFGHFHTAVNSLTVYQITTLGVTRGGECSADPNTRTPILFPHNAVTGCTFRSPSGDCAELRSQIYQILQGESAPTFIAMNSGSQPNWTRVINQKCPVSLGETCESGCTLPYSLSVQVLWARQGLLHLPQSFILGAAYLFQCQRVKCPLSSPLPVSTEVTFADTSLYPEPPRGAHQPDWKFPFGFFSRGAAELDGHIVCNHN
ncbi:tectonic-3-like [Aulostomus maculatus]